MSRTEWEENRYDVAGRTQVQGIASTISSCSASNAKVLELRLKNSFSQLDFSVAQSDDSDASSQNVTVEVQANNSQVEIQRVPFNQVENFTIPVNGVNALQILVYLDSEVQGCSSGGSVVAVMTDAKLS